MLRDPQAIDGPAARTDERKRRPLSRSANAIPPISTKIPQGIFHSGNPPAEFQSLRILEFAGFPLIHTNLSSRPIVTPVLAYYGDGKKSPIPIEEPGLPAKRIAGARKRVPAALPCIEIRFTVVHFPSSQRFLDVGMPVPAAGMERKPSRPLLIAASCQPGAAPRPRPARNLRRRTAPSPRRRSWEA